MVGHRNVTLPIMGLLSIAHSYHHFIQADLFFNINQLEISNEDVPKWPQLLVEVQTEYPPPFPNTKKEKKHFYFYVVPNHLHEWSAEVLSMFLNAFLEEAAQASKQYFLCPG